MSYQVFPKGADIQLSKNLHLSEVDCKCVYETCQRTIFHESVIRGFQMLRKWACIPLIVSSGYRCARHNLDTPKSSKNSDHMYGLAIDIKKPSHGSLLIIEQAKFIFDDVIEYDTFFHCAMKPNGFKLSDPSEKN
jgi:hypothetical protein